MSTEEKRRTTFKSNTDEIFETLTWNNKTGKEKNQCIMEKNRSTEHSKENKTVPGRVATTSTEGGHKQNAKISTTISTKMMKEHRMTKEEMEGTTSS